MTFKDEVTKILDELVNKVEWCVNPVAGAVAVDREKEQIAQAKATQALLSLHESEVRKARIDDLERLQESFGERGIVTFDMSYDEEAEAVAIANVLNKITDRIKALTTNTGGQE